MKVSTARLKEFNSTYKEILFINDVPVLIAKPKRIEKLIKYLMNGEPVPSDGKIRKILDKFKEV